MTYGGLQRLTLALLLLGINYNMAHAGLSTAMHLMGLKLLVNIRITQQNDSFVYFRYFLNLFIHNFTIFVPNMLQVSTGVYLQEINPGQITHPSLSHLRAI